VDARTAVDAVIRLYDSLFDIPEPDLADCNYLEHLSPDSLKVISGAKLEVSLASAQPAESFQFLRLGYFCADSIESAAGSLVFNRSVSLKDSFRV
jgi:glutaminyl-tRNA synthetase